MAKALELTAQRFGRLVVIKRVENGKGGNAQWLCDCDCGNEHITTASRLNTGKVSSCGCVQKEAARKNMTKHGLSNHPLYAVHKEMRARTENSKNSHYKYYGGRGIAVCKEWLAPNGFLTFYQWAIENGYRGGLSIDRIDNDGNYEPSNCRWTDTVTQANNTSQNVNIEFNDRTLNITQWSRELGGNDSLVSDRLKWGWSIERALTTPPRPINNITERECEY